MSSEIKKYEEANNLKTKKEISEIKNQINFEQKEKNDLFELKIGIFLEDIDKNINNLITFIKENYSWNEAKLREIFMSKISDEDYELFYYNNDKLLRFLNAKILFWDKDFVQSKNVWVLYKKDPNNGNFYDKNWEKLLIYRNSIISTSPVIEKFGWKTIKLGWEKKDYPLNYVWSNTIYLTIWDDAYWEYTWNPEQSRYILQDHKDWELPLIIKKQKHYTITFKDKVINW